MKIAAVLVLIVGHACAAPESYLVDRQSEEQAQFQYDASSLPYLSRKSRGTQEGTASKLFFERPLDPVELIYESAGSSNDGTQAVVKRVSFESLLDSKDSDRVLNRVARSHDFSDDPSFSNEMPTVEFGKLSENPTAEMYDDNFGGEHDSQDGMIPEETLRSQHLSYDGRAFGMEAHGIWDGGIPEHQNPWSDFSGPGTVRRIQHFQALVPNQATVHARFLKSLDSASVPRFQLDSMPSPSMTEIRSHDAFHPVPNGMVNPRLISSPNGGLFSTYTNIVEFVPQGEHCKKNHIRMKRDTEYLENGNTRDANRRRPSYEEAEVKQQPQEDDNYEAFFSDDLSRHGGLGPKIFKLKVRKGGVAIAGPGGIATAGSGGTAIVGPGGTAYTTQDGTAVVGPGGRVIEIPSNFPITKIEARATDPHHIFVPPGGRIIAKGPFVYYGFRDHNQQMAVHHGKKDDPSKFIPSMVERL
ncbi:Hypothetical protein NTJ_13481 [Nesidiocoris tenuis]|uniref:DUF4774 domain-containing protein n=1 Tax=Nesidiocoris tenuis TaxID=355587 RepID=A0ABN7B8E6_9HEMI|nr:Hypothetical protein NTJ_13481 [Nesidiocoris tenuis]